MPAPTTYQSSELLATRDGLAIYGQLFVPRSASDAPLPTVVCAHSFGANYLSCVPYAWALAERGFATYCFDFPGGGYASRSEGNPLEMTITTQADDLAVAIDTLASLDQVDEERIYVLGEGQGGIAATLFADTYPLAICGLVLVHPTFNLHDQTRSLFPTKKNIPTSYRRLGMRVGRAYGEAAWDINPYSCMHRFDGKVLIIHGDEDTAVPIEYSRRAANVFVRAQLKVISHGRHAFKGDAQTQCIDAVCDFLSRDALMIPEELSTQYSVADPPSLPRYRA